MRWLAGDHGMHMTLSRDVPEQIAAVLRAFVLELYQRAGIELDRMRDSDVRGPSRRPAHHRRRAAQLELDEPQVAASREVLLDYGNMSSATLPHVWMRLDQTAAAGTLIASLAFGPGLTVCGALFEKQ